MQLVTTKRNYLHRIRDYMRTNCFNCHSIRENAIFVTQNKDC
jgi:hypothetical protein